MEELDRNRASACRVRSPRPQRADRSSLFACVQEWKENEQKSKELPRSHGGRA